MDRQADISHGLQVDITVIAVFLVSKLASVMLTFFGLVLLARANRSGVNTALGRSTVAAIGLMLLISAATLLLAGGLVASILTD
jgi:hypothetical protein